MLRIAVNVADEVLVAIGRNDDRKAFARIIPAGVRIVKDRGRRKSPLIGIVAGFQSMSCKYSLVLSCDTPFVNRAVLQYLFRASRGVDALVPMWPNDDLEPLQAVYKVDSMLSAARLVLEQPSIRIRDVIRRLNKVRYLPVRSIERLDRHLITYFNVNTQEDLHLAQIYLADSRETSAKIERQLRAQHES